MIPFFIGVILVACNIIPGAVIAGISISFSSFFRLVVRGFLFLQTFFFLLLVHFYVFLFQARKCSDAHARLIVRQAYQETCVTINDDREKLTVRR